ADQGHGDGLALQLFEDARAFLFVDVDEHRVGRGGLDLADVGGEIGLARFGGEVGGDLDAVLAELLGDDVAAAPAEIIVDPDDRNRFRLHFVVDVFGDL